MSCDRYTGAIVDYVCGADIAADAAAHLQACAECTRLFDEQRRRLQDLDQELQVALVIEPSAGFVAETMAQAERSTNHRRAAMWWGVSAAAAVLIVVTLGSLRFSERRPADRHLPMALETTATARDAGGTPTNATPSAPAGTAPRLAAAPRRISRPATAVREPDRRLDTDVVVPPGQLQAIERYMTLVRRGTLDTSPLANTDKTDVTAPTDLVIAPLSVDVLVVPNGESGTASGADRSEQMK